MGFTVGFLFMSVHSECSNCLKHINGECCELENQGMCCNYAAINGYGESKAIKDIDIAHGNDI